MARPSSRDVYPHLGYDALDAKLGELAGEADRVLVVTDGVFSMRGDYADLGVMAEIVARHDASFPENVVLVVDDSHGVGAFGKGGRGTEAVTGGAADILIGTLGKAFGVNGGYVTGSTAMTSAADTAVSIVDSSEGDELLDQLAELTGLFESGLTHFGFETIPGPHPVVPLMVRDTERTSALVGHLFDHGILATGLNFPVVPQGDEEIRFQVNADHTQADIDHVLDVLRSF
jgi:glycine C-acetyltransferase